ncbi:MAG: hypothetical protein PUB42_02945 [Firmicutes bacterium]|nr:hypothetical protein [Bacillota bacterium]
MKKNMFCIFIVCCTIMLLWLVFSIKYDNIDYWKTIGVSDNGLYDTLIAEKGEPKDIECIDDDVYVIYDGVKFCYLNKELSGSFIRAEICTDKYVFGKQKISVGTDKKTIVSYYKNKRSLNDLPDDELAYICNSNTIIWFEFDKNDKVKKIILTWEM